MNPTIAREISERFQEVSSLCNSSVRTIKSEQYLGQIQIYGRLAGRFMGYAQSNILAPIRAGFPQLEPPAMKESYVKPKPTLTRESEKALRNFLVEAKATIDFAKTSVSPEEAAIESFFREPRYKDEEGTDES